MNIEKIYSSLDTWLNDLLKPIVSKYPAINIISPYIKKKLLSTIKEHSSWLEVFANENGDINFNDLIVEFERCPKTEFNSKIFEKITIGNGRLTFQKIPLINETYTITSSDIQILKNLINKNN